MTGVEISPSDHSKPPVRKVLSDLVKNGWTLRKEGHWGKLYCPCADGGCTTISISGTPRNPDWHAAQIKRQAARCPLPRDDPRRSLTGMKRDSES